MWQIHCTHHAKHQILHLPQKVTLQHQQRFQKAQLLRDFPKLAECQLLYSQLLLRSASLLAGTLTLIYSTRSYSTLSCSYSKLLLLSATLALSSSFSQQLYSQLLLLSATLILSNSTVSYSCFQLLYSQLLFTFLSDTVKRRSLLRIQYGIYIYIFREWFSGPQMPISARPHVGQQPKWHELPHRSRWRARLGYILAYFSCLERNLRVFIPFPNLFAILAQIPYWIWCWFLCKTIDKARLARLVS